MPYTVLVTVGSTRFDALVHAALSDAFVDAVRDVGGADARVIVQYGQSAVPPSAWPTEPRSIEGIVWERAVVGGVEVLRGAYVPELRPWLAQADVVICRAGAVTVSELCAAGVASILVPLVATAGFLLSVGASFGAVVAAVGLLFWLAGRSWTRLLLRSAAREPAAVGAAVVIQASRSPPRRIAPCT
mgnify:CR=1 FL=1